MNIQDFGRIKSDMTNLADGTATTLIGSPGPQKRWWLMAFAISNSNTTTPTLVSFRSGADVIWRVPVPVSAGVVQSFPIGLPLAGDSALVAIASVDLSGAVDVSWQVLEAPL